jgi:hypothetical protein
MSVSANAVETLPRIERTGSGFRLIVDDEPFVVRGGELGNSAAHRPYLSERWETLVSLGLNAIVAPATWELIEPVEGAFDWTSVDQLVEDAADHGMRVVLLWFGSWKNSMSSYVPEWVKTDTERFPRCRDVHGRPLEILTPFSDENRDADARAFAALMAHLRETDTARTVIMVQVENEIGIMPEARDHSDLAEAAYDGSEDEEVFMARAFARYVDSVARAGRAELELPLFVNAALIRPGAQPGQYPGAGPLPHLAEVWRENAPHIDFLAPDIYFPNFAEWAGRYATADNPLFIPEALRSTDASVNALYAFGEHSALGFAAFGIENIGSPADRFLTASYELLRQLEPLLAEVAGTGRSRGLLPPHGAHRPPHRIQLGGYTLNATYERLLSPGLADGVINEADDRSSSTTLLPAGAIVIQTGDDEFIVAGTGVTITFAPDPAGADTVGILRCDEGGFDRDGVWRTTRRLNGDETHQGRHLRLVPGEFSMQRIALYRYR